MKKHVALLKGGLSSEREISLISGAAIADGLKQLGHKVSEIDVSYDVADILHKLRPDIAFNALHGTYGEDGCIQGVLEFLQIPYTHSGVLASAIAMHKPTAKILFQSAGILCAKGRVVSIKELAFAEIIKPPYVIKPVNEGSSIGVYIVRNGNNKDEIIKAELSSFSETKEFLVEKYISGRELTIAVLNGKALGVLEIRPKRGFYDYRNKYTKGNTEYIVPAPIPKEIYDKAMNIAEKAHNVLGCRGVSRTDVRYSDEDNELYILEVNTHPGFTPTSLVPKIAAHAGINFVELLEKILETARLDNKPFEKRDDKREKE